MTSYFLDYNIWLRLFIKDNQTQYKQSVQYFNLAKAGRIHLILLPQILIETEYVLRKVYRLTKDKYIMYLTRMVNTVYIEVRQKEILAESLKIFKTKSVDLIDSYLITTANNESAQVLSFDKDFQKLAVVLGLPAARGVGLGLLSNLLAS